ncbi:MAG: SAM-dependent methyltransferase, partial [Oscillospiraceae bacterium]
CRDILTDNPLFFALNSYTAGLAPSAMGYVVATAFSGFKSCRVESEEIGIPVSGSGLALPCGATTLALF